MGVFFQFCRLLRISELYKYIHTQIFSIFQNILNYQPNSYNSSRLEEDTTTLDPDDIDPIPPQLTCCTSNIILNCNPQCPCCKDGSDPGTDCGQPCNQSTTTIPTTLQPRFNTLFPTNQTTAQPCPSPPCSTNQTTPQPCLTPPCSTIQPVQTTTFLKFAFIGKINGIRLRTGDQEMTKNMLNVKICSGKENYE